MENEMLSYESIFGDDVTAKAKSFDRIANEFYYKNFGRCGKADFEVLMFDILMEKIIDGKETIDYVRCSDYRMGRMLGITESKVRNLKVKKELAYPQKDFDWKQSFAKLLTDRKKVEVRDGRLIMHIPDPNLYFAIRNFVEELGGYVDIHLNSRILDMRIEYLFDFAVAFEENADEVREEFLKKIKQIKKNVKIEKTKSIAKTVLDAGVDIADIVANVSSLFTGEGVGKMAIKAIASLIKKGEMENEQ